MHASQKRLVLMFTLHNAPPPLYAHTPSCACMHSHVRAIVLPLSWYSARERAHFNILSYASVYPYVWHIQNLCLNHRKSTGNRAITHTHLCTSTQILMLYIADTIRTHRMCICQHVFTHTHLYIYCIWTRVWSKNPSVTAWWKSNICDRANLLQILSEKCQPAFVHFTHMRNWESPITRTRGYTNMRKGEKKAKWAG